MLTVALISIRGWNRHTCVRGSVKHKIIRAYIEERSPMRSAHHHRSCFTGDTGQNPKMTRILRISHFTHFSRKNEDEAFRSVEYKQTNAVGWIWATFRVQTCFLIFEVIWVISGPCAWGSGIPPSVTLVPEMGWLAYSNGKCSRISKVTYLRSMNSLYMFHYSAISLFSISSSYAV